MKGFERKRNCIPVYICLEGACKHTIRAQTNKSSKHNVTNEHHYQGKHKHCSMVTLIKPIIYTRKCIVIKRGLKKVFIQRDYEIAFINVKESFIVNAFSGQYMTLIFYFSWYFCQNKTDWNMGGRERERERWKKSSGRWKKNKLYNL